MAIYHQSHTLQGTEFNDKWCKLNNFHYLWNWDFRYCLWFCNHFVRGGGGGGDELIACWLIAPSHYLIEHWLIIHIILKVYFISIHYRGIIMSAVAFQITRLTIVYSTVYSGADQRKHQSSALLAFVQGIHRWPVNSPHKWPVTQENVSIWWRHHFQG